MDTFNVPHLKGRVGTITQQVQPTYIVATSSDQASKLLATLSPTWTRVLSWRHGSSGSGQLRDATMWCGSDWQLTATLIAE
ncbi:hypothetical protein F441_17923 [Phytophthora nicotianae CJ01A1]|uniref:Uncharacterized protein n=6 Tax=Phytophthora nicotianae TaxID=4792 RepID=W2PMX7_PHYN3|nr:hypothetical protein PPTG_23966 [Phytophthora nicotianae INRA-310]ETI35669.1 hypothetical protein F443_18047 [Phytophthora nicotianae P1569]ETK75911.1 hypothetical protein L915_17566 [Phytophthora nicotianae]ETO64401.1 hypothetical protein F444_18070 [Phytophthora nicotianae P1976]ETP05488.1 hypothetical protein F441_17923 [Phytophthora nicotianae CJ01A1]ETP33622.1 hypothetical protein F442_17891 [Phytophthora nicotianae P10297]